MLDAHDTPLLRALLVATSLLAAGAGFWLSARVAAREDEPELLRRVVRNSTIPIASQLLIRAVDLLVALVVLRLLGPEGNGRYALAVVVWLYVKTVSDFGLSVLATRDIARDRDRAGQIVGQTTLLRLVVLLMAAVPVGLYSGIGLARGSLAGETVVAIGLLYLSIVPSSYGEAVSAALNGFERMDAAAWLNIAVNVARAPLAIVLAGTRFGVVGLAVGAVLGALLSAALFGRAYRAIVGRPAVWSLDRCAARDLARESWPLLVNALLISLFFRLDVFVVQAFAGDRALGVYDAAYKLINLVTVVPAYATLALFPVLATRGGDPEELLRLQRAASVVLLWLAWAIVVAATAGAGAAIRLLAGGDYLPQAAELLRILIWFAPLSFFNGVVQYVLVAAGLQRRVVPAFAAAVGCNLALNLLLVPLTGARGAAAATVATEVVIFLAFWAVTRRRLPVVSRDTLRPLWRPTAAGLPAAAAALAAAVTLGELAAIPLGVLTFALLGLALGRGGTVERQLLARLIGRRTRLAGP